MLDGDAQSLKAPLSDTFAPEELEKAYGGQRSPRQRLGLEAKEEAKKSEEEKEETELKM